MIKKILIEEMKVITAKKNGEPLAYVDKQGRTKTFERIEILTTIDGLKRWMSGADFDGSFKGVQPGVSMELEVYEEPYNGKQYLKFKKPKAQDFTLQRIEKLEKEMLEVKALLSKLKDSRAPAVPTPPAFKEEDYPEPDEEFPLPF